MEERSEVSASLSTQILIEVQLASSTCYDPVGAIKEFIVTQNRNIERDINDDGSITLRPSPHVDTTITLKRVVFDDLAITEAFGLQTTMLSNQLEPFNIRVTKLTQQDTHTTTYHNCFFLSYTTPIKADAYTIIEEAIVICEYIATEHKFNWPSA